jgi:hypothetical protein
MTGTPPLAQRLRDWLSDEPESKPPYDEILEATDTIEALLSALENLVLHVGMGWETDEMLEKASAAIAKTRGQG